METNRIIQGDSMDVLDELESESVHAVVCDPPYGLNFMGRDWDNFRRRNNDADVDRDNVGGRLSEKAPASGAETDMHEYQKWCRQWAQKAMDVLKPGGHMLAFSGNRTHHRLFSGVEDAGFEIRDTLTWHYGSGFPKALDVSKAIDKKADADREVVDTVDAPDNRGNSEAGTGGYSSGVSSERDRLEHEVTKPATDAAEQWAGWKTCLKPATEFIVLARKPLGEDTVAENTQEHGTGALNIDGCRVQAEDGFSWEVTDMPERTNRPSADVPDGNAMARRRDSDDDGETKQPDGRYPSNLIFDQVAAEQLDHEIGELSSGARPAGDYGAASGGTYGEYDSNERKERLEYSSGGPSRYFYTSKATKAERTLEGKIENGHPTVKPVDLMEWLVKLVTAEGQVVLDPFTGSGTTCKAAKNLHREFVGIEKQERWADVARVRCGLTPHDPGHVRPDDGAQQGLELYTDGGL